MTCGRIFQKLGGVDQAQSRAWALPRGQGFEVILNVHDGAAVQDDGAPVVGAWKTPNRR